MTDKKSDAGLKKMKSSQRPFGKANFLMMGGCLLLIIVGFLLMSGSGSSIEGGFNPDVFSTRRIVVGPLLAFLGFLLMAPAIIYTPASSRRAIAEHKEAEAVSAAEPADKPE